MWDTYEHHTHSHSHSRNVTVKEERAPTDDSIRLAIELEEKLKGKILKSYVLENNVFKGLVHIDEDILNCRIMIKAVFRLNGENMEVEHSFNAISTDDLDKEFINLHNKIAHRIASALPLKPKRWDE